MHNDGHQRLSTRSTIGNAYYIHFDSYLLALTQNVATTTTTTREHPSACEGGLLAPTPHCFWCEIDWQPRRTTEVCSARARSMPTAFRSGAMRLLLLLLLHTSLLVVGSQSFERQLGTPCCLPPLDIHSFSCHSSRLISLCGRNAPFIAHIN